MNTSHVLLYIYNVIFIEGKNEHKINYDLTPLLTAILYYFKVTYFSPMRLFAKRQKTEKEKRMEKEKGKIIFYFIVAACGL